MNRCSVDTLTKQSKLSLLHLIIGAEHMLWQIIDQPDVVDIKNAVLFVWHMLWRNGSDPDCGSSSYIITSDLSIVIISGSNMYCANNYGFVIGSR